MTTFKNINQLNAYLNKQLESVLLQVGQEVKKIIEGYIQDRLYDSYQPFQYSRTYDFLNSLTVKKPYPLNGGYAVEVYFDTDKIRQAIVEDSKWNQHMSYDGSDTWNGVKVNKLIPYFMEYGVEGSLWDRDGIYAVRDTIVTLEETKLHVKELGKLLKQKGFSIKIK